MTTDSSNHSDLSAWFHTPPDYAMQLHRRVQRLLLGATQNLQPTLRALTEPAAAASAVVGTMNFGALETPMDISDTTTQRLRLRPPPVEVRDTGTPKGLGVFALADFATGAVVEVCPVLLFRMPIDSLPGAFKLRVFDWQVLAGQPQTHALALGYGSMYNSANPANMQFKALRAIRNPLIEFVAARLIKAGEELTVNYSGYGGAAESADNHWFQRMGVDRQ